MLTKTKSAAVPKEATALLRADDKLVSELFAEFETARTASKKMQLSPAFAPS